MAFEDDIKQLEDATDIVSLVSSYNIKLEKKGKNFVALCPFHNEKTGSFSVNTERNIAHCFSCGGGGRPIKFIMQIEGIGFQEAVYKLAKFNGIEYKGNFQVKEDPNKKYYEILKLAIDFYKLNYEKTEYGKEAREYLLKRGLTDEVIKDFNIGLAPKQYDTLYKVLKESNYLELDMIDSGLINSDEKSYHDFFVSRIMFPIYNENGNPIGFSARIFNNDDKSQPKYVNSRESMVYHKGDVLFNIQNAKGEIRKNKRVILHEGQMDVIAAYRSGFKEAICTMGTALTITQARLLSNYTNNAIICYDGDNAGIKASKKAIKIFKQIGFNVRLVLLPKGMDPDEYVLKYGVEEYKKYFESHIIDALEYQYITTLVDKNLNDNIVFKNVCEEIFELLVNENSQSIREVYLSRLSKDTNTSLDAIHLDFDAYNSKNMPSNNDYYPPYEEQFDYQENLPKEIKEVWNSTAELRLFIYAKESKANAIYIDETLGDSIYGFKPKTLNLWFKLINEYYANFDKFEEGKFIMLLTNQDDVNYYTQMMEVVSKDHIEPYNQQDMIKCIEKIVRDCCDAKNVDIKRKVASANTSTEKKFQYVNEAFINRKKKLELAKKNKKN